MSVWCLAATAVSAAVLLSLPIMFGVFAWYNIGWMKSRFNNLEKHVKTFKADMDAAIANFNPAGFFLCECGVIEEGLPWDTWREVLRRVFGGGYAMWVDSHYTCILKTDVLEVLSPPGLRGPLST